MDDLRQCRDLLQEVSSRLSRLSSASSEQQYAITNSPSTAVSDVEPATTTPLAAQFGTHGTRRAPTVQPLSLRQPHGSATHPSGQLHRNELSFQEHRNLLGFCPATASVSHSGKRKAGSKGNAGARQTKAPKRATWKRKLCLKLCLLHLWHLLVLSLHQRLLISYLHQPLPLSCLHQSLSQSFLHQKLCLLHLWHLLVLSLHQRLLISYLHQPLPLSCLHQSLSQSFLHQKLCLLHPSVPATAHTVYVPTTADVLSAPVIVPALSAPVTVPAPSSPAAIHTVSEPTAPASESTAAVVSVIEKSIDTLVEETITHCTGTDKSNNPVEILRHLQKIVVTGRELEISDVSQSLEGETNFIMVNRDSLLKTAFDEFQDCPASDWRKTLEVGFYGEKASDYGGPRKEFFVQILREIKEKYFDHGLNESLANDYHIIGIIMSLSMLQNGPLPRFLDENLLEAIFHDGDVASGHICLQQLRKGLSELGIYQIAKQIPTFLHLFRNNSMSALTVRIIVHLLTPDFSEAGSNARKHEQEVYEAFLKYIREAARGRRNDGAISLENILQFVTGCTEEPVLWFSMQPSLMFHAADIGFLPTENTCSNCIWLPRPSLQKPLPSLEDLFNLYDYAFSNFHFGKM